MLRSVALQVWLVQAAAQRNYRPILKLREKGRRCEMGIKKGAGRDGLVTTKSGGARLASFMQARVEGRGRGESVATVQSDHVELNYLEKIYTPFLYWIFQCTHKCTQCGTSRVAIAVQLTSLRVCPRRALHSVIIPLYHTQTKTEFFCAYHLTVTLVISKELWFFWADLLVEFVEYSKQTMASARAAVESLDPLMVAQVWCVEMCACCACVCEGWMVRDCTPLSLPHIYFLNNFKLTSILPPSTLPTVCRVYCEEGNSTKQP